MSVTAGHATSTFRASDVCRQIRRLFREKKPSPSEETQLDALLGAAQRLSEKRNSYLHSAWSETSAGQAVLQSDTHQWEQAPSETEVERVTSEILAVGRKINDARLHGLISKAVARYRRK